jgi:N-acetylneuraminate synthase
VDSSFSIEPSELKQLVLETERAHQALGNVSYGATSSEEKSLQFRRSLYIVKDMIKGEVITCEHIRSIRPGFGLPVKDYDQVIGRVVNRALARGTALSWEYL